MTYDSGLSPSGLICCYAMGPVKLTQSPLVIQPPFAWQQGSLTYILSWAFQLALVGLRCLRVPQSWLVGWLLRPDVVCSMSLDSGLSFPGFICCYAMSLWWLTYSPWLYALSCLATGIVNLFLSWACQLALAGLRCLRVPQSCGVQSLRDGVTCPRLGLCFSSVHDRNEDCPSYWGDWFRAFAMGSPVSGRGCVLHMPLRWGHPSQGQVCVGASHI